MLLRSLWYVICIQKRDEAYFMTLLKTVETTPGLYYSCEVDLSLRWVISMIFANNFILKNQTEMEVPESCVCFTACKKTVFNNISEAVVFCFLYWILLSPSCSIMVTWTDKFLFQFHTCLIILLQGKTNAAWFGKIFLYYVHLYIIRQRSLNLTLTNYLSQHQLTNNKQVIWWEKD